MNTILKRTIAITELLLVLPATLFMTALFVRNLQPDQYEPAQTARRLVEWFSARPFLCLDIFLIALPFAALIIGCASVLRSWHRDAELRQAALEMFVTVRAHVATLLIGVATLMAAGILGIVAIHTLSQIEA